MDESRDAVMDEFDVNQDEVVANPNDVTANTGGLAVEPDTSITAIDWSTNAQDVTPAKNGGVLKIIIEEGIDNEFPVEGDTVSVSYDGFYEDGRAFDCSHNENNPYEFVIGKGNVIKAWDLGLSTMRLNEKSVFFCRPAYAYGIDGFPPLIPGSANIIFRIKVLQFKGEDITKLKDGGIRKSILEKGEGLQGPNDGGTCTVHFRGKCGGRLFDDRTCEFVMGEGGDFGIVSGLEYALKHFRRGERSRLEIVAKYGYGASGHREYGIPPNADLFYEVTMINFTRIKDHWDMNMNERLQYAETAKERGTEFFKVDKYNLAKKRYKQAVQYLDIKISLDDEEATKRNQLLLACHLNLALCHLKLGDDLSALYSSCLGLELDPTNDKGLYRKGMANFNLDNLEDAFQDFTTLLNHHPQNKAGRQQLEITKQKMKAVNDKQKFIFGGMFKKFADHDAKADQQHQHIDVFSDIGEWNNEMAKDMMTLEQEMAAFGEQMPAPKYNSRQDGKENENPGSDED